jgi:hypothetical protein
VPQLEKKTVVIDESTGIPRRFVESKATNLESLMGRRRRIDPTDTLALRNGVWRRWSRRCLGRARAADCRWR